VCCGVSLAVEFMFRGLKFSCQNHILVYADDINLVNIMN
jgi:hypothetical protein